MADAKLSALSQISVPALADPVYGEQGGVSGQYTLDRLLGAAGFIPGGRLTLTTGVPVTISDASGGTLYYTPHVHNFIRVYDGTRWLLKVFAEISLALTVTSGKNYDVFCDDDAATLVLSSAWTNDTTRADALGTQDSVTVLSSDHTKRWLGTIRASAANTCEDSQGGLTTQVGGKRFVSNAYNAVVRPMNLVNLTDSYNYTGTATRVAQGATPPLMCVEFVMCQIAAVSAHILQPWAGVSNTATSAKVGVGVDSTSVLAKSPGGGAGNGYNGSAATVISPLVAIYDGTLAAGYHQLACLEAGGSTGSSIFYGDSGGAGEQQTMNAKVWG